MGIIQLKDIKVYGHHGCTLEEQKIGNNFIVNITVSSDLSKSAITDALTDTIDYAQLHNIVVKEMKISAKLLEHLVGRINKNVITTFPEIKSVETQILKERPPFGGNCGFSSVTIKAYNNEK